MITSGTKRFEELWLRDDVFNNPRTSSGLAPTDIRELARSLLAHGLLVPLVVAAVPENERGITGGLVLAGQRRYRALGLLSRWRNDWEFVSELGPPMSAPEQDKIDARVEELLAAVPVRFIRLEVRDASTFAAVALIDNLHRSDLSSFEIAQSLASIAAGGVSGAEIARMIGKSKSYVSRKLSTWGAAGVELRRAWEHGDLADEAVQQLAELPEAEQERALSGPVPRGRRGPAHRPSVDAVRDFLHELEAVEFPPGMQLSVGNELREFSYRAGVLDALRWATGHKTSPEFVKIASEES